MLKDFSHLLLVVLCDYGEYGENTSRWCQSETNALVLVTLCGRRWVGQLNPLEAKNDIVTLASQEILYFRGLYD